jgi:rod shape-determining protein MreC
MVNDSRRTRAILAVLLLVSLALITLDFRGGAASPLRGLRQVGAAIFGPVERGVAGAVRPVADFVQGVTGGPSALRRAEALERENQRLREQLRSGQIDRDRAGQLDRLLHSAGLGGYKIQPAQVVSAGQGFEETVTIDVGHHDGIRPDMTVLTGEGLVGRVIRVGPATSIVLLLTDASSSMGGRLEDSKEIGIVQGAGRRGIAVDGAAPLRFHLLDPGASLTPGQRVVSFGSRGSQPYVPGVPIGTVAKVEQTPGSLTRTAVLNPFVRFTGLDVVGVVVTSPKKDPRDAVLPPRPTPSPSPSPSSTATPRPSPSPSRRGEEPGQEEPGQEEPGQEESGREEPGRDEGDRTEASPATDPTQRD